jgi:hypothetical protein
VARILGEWWSSVPESSAEAMFNRSIHIRIPSTQCLLLCHACDCSINILQLESG